MQGLGEASEPRAVLRYAVWLMYVWLSKPQCGQLLCNLLKTLPVITADLIAF